MPPNLPTLDRFDIEKSVGEGGMGTVYRAIDRQSGMPVALKVALSDDENYRRRALVEAGALASLDHPAIVRLVASGIAPDGHAYLAMEWLDGEDLGARLRRGMLSLGDMVTLGVRVAEGLAAAHAVNIVHRDLKPSNIFLPGGDVSRAKLVDFGIARMGQRRMTQTGALLGTPGYMAPEQARGEGDVGPAVDMFALGTVLFECLAGRPAFVGEHAIAILAKVLFDEPPSLSNLRPDLPVAIVQFIGRMFIKTPAQRPTARETADTLRGLLPSLAHTIGAVPDGAWANTIGGAPENGQTHELPLSSEQRLVCVLVVRPRGLAASHKDESNDEPAPSVLPNESDPIERLRAIVAPLGGRAERLLDGTLIASWTGSGIPRDLAARAARAALLARERLPGNALALGSGLAAANSLFRFGAALDRAAAAVGNANGSSVFIDDVTAGLLDDRFTVEQSPVGYQLVGRRSLDDGQARRVAGRASPCVGRERELRMLGDLLDECIDAPRACVAVVTAPPGIGKSRLCQEMLRVVRLREDVDVWSAEADEFGGGSPFALVGAAVQCAIGVKPIDSMEERRRKLTTRVARHVPEKERARVAALLGEIAAAPFPTSAHPLLASARHDPSVMAEQVRRAFIDLLTAETEHHTVLLVFEDLHWGDPPSLKLVTAALTALRDRPLMLLGFARPEASQVFSELWSLREMQEIRLSGLTKRAAAKLAQHALPNADAALVQRLVERADGNALYLEELVRAAASGRGDDLPETVAAMVQARLGELPAEERRILRAASVFGGAFWYGAINAILGAGTNRSSPIATSMFDSLVEHEVFEKREESRFPEDQEFNFRHALLREGAYSLLTEADRGTCHFRAAEWLEQQAFARDRSMLATNDGSPKSVTRREWRGRADETGAARIAQHFELGGAMTRAVEWHGRAASHALRSGDPSGAAISAERGLELFKALPDATDRPMQELDLRISHFRGLMPTRGYTAPEVRRSLFRAHELCPRDAPERYDVVHGLWHLYLASGDPWTARAYSVDLLALANAGDKPLAMVAAHLAIGMTCLFLGELNAAREHLEAGLALFDRDAHPEAILIMGADIEVLASGYLAMTYWTLGLFEKGLSTIKRALDIAEELAHPFTQTGATSFAAIHYQARRDRTATLDYATRAHTLATEHGFAHYVVQSSLLRRWASPESADRVAEMASAIATRRARGNLIAMPHLLTLLVDVQLFMGLIDDTFSTLEDAVAITNKNGERLHAAEIHRLMGEAFIARGQPGDLDRAEDALLRACEVAHYQSALTLELRAATSLARLWRKVGNGQEGWQKLSAVFARVSEGFNTLDVQEARALLDEDCQR